MDLTSHMRYDIDTLRTMTIDQIFELHRNKVLLPVGKTYDELIACIKETQIQIGIKLTNEQLNFVLSAFHGVPLVAESCPGSGKTTVSQFIIIIYVKFFGIDSKRILLTSFSNNSSSEIIMRNMTYSQRTNVEPVPIIKTMHGWYLSFLNQYISYLGLLPTIDKLTKASDEFLNSTFDSCYKEVMQVKAVSRNKRTQMIALYNYIYDAMVYGKEEQVTHLRQFTELDMEYKDVMAIFNKYTMSKRVTGQIDYMDMQTLFYELLKTHPEVAKTISSYFDIILIDEVQDTSKLQFAIYRMLITAVNESKFVVIGDNDQGIYRWRGTSKEPFVDFFRLFPTAQLVTLGYNMRSGKEIVKYANNLISHTENRVDKKMVALRPIDSRVFVQPCKSRQEAVDYCYKVLMDAKAKIGTDYDKMKEYCVLVRNHNQALWLIDKLLASGVNVKVLGDVFPYSDKIITDLVEIMKAILSPTDPKLGRFAIPKLCQDITDKKFGNQILMQMNMGKPIGKVILNVQPTRRNPQPTINQDLDTIDKLTHLENPTVAMLCRVLIPLYRRGSYDYFAKGNCIDPEHSELLFEYMLSQNMTLNEFVIKLSTIQQQLSYNLKQDMGFRISSMHGSKGNEYDNVFILDSSASSCPSSKKLEEYPSDIAWDFLEEERNLFYVAITRARLNLYVTYNQFRPSLFNAESGLIKSEHLNNVQKLPQHMIDYKSKQMAMPQPKAVQSTPVEVQANKGMEEVAKLQDSQFINSKGNLQSKSHTFLLPDISLNIEYRKILDNLNLG